MLEIGNIGGIIWDMLTHNAYIIAGPTASGKSDFAHRLAQAVGGTIINCDSVQIYRGIENIAASPFAGRPVTDEIDGVPYRLFSILDLNSHLSVADYLTLARVEYGAARGAGRVPIFVGGTGFYINAIVSGMSPVPDVDLDVRRRARELVARDIVAARAVLPDEFPHTDPQRVARAIEVFMQTGRHITEFQSMPRVGAIVPTPHRILISPETDILRERIAARIPQMLSGGAMAEAQNIIDNNQNASRAIGAMQLCSYLRGEIGRDECIADWIIKTNQYAKRQRTWFRGQFAADTVITDINSVTF